jgi:hypothetical protein
MEFGRLPPQIFASLCGDTQNRLIPGAVLSGGADRRWLIHCRGWHAPQFVAFPTGDVDPPCSIFGNDSEMPKADNPEFSTVTIRSGFVEFHTMEGERITAAW